MEWALTCATLIGCLASSSACTGPRNTRGPGWVWLPCSASSTATAAAFGPKPSSIKAQLFISRWGTETAMIDTSLRKKEDAARSAVSSSEMAEAAQRAEDRND